MQKKSFTLIEIVVTFVILIILVTLGVPLYQNTIEDSKAKICKSNLQTLQAALDLYAMEHDALPGSISQIPGEYIKRGYARVLEKEGKNAWKTKLADFLINLDNKRLTFASPPPTDLSIKNDLAKGDMKLITCPADPAPSPSHGSYGLNASLQNMTSSTYRALSSGTILIGDCVNATFTDTSGLAKRHKHSAITGAQGYAQYVTKSREVKTTEQAQGPTPPGGSSSDCAQVCIACQDESWVAFFRFPDGTKISRPDCSQRCHCQ